MREQPGVLRGLRENDEVKGKTMNETIKIAIALECAAKYRETGGNDLMNAVVELRRLAAVERQLAEARKASIGEPVAEVKAQSDSIGGTFIQRYAELAPGTKLYTSPQAAQPLKPDMFWNSDDADEPHDSIECFLNDQICQHDLEVGAVFTIWQAKKLPSVTIRVTAIDEEECEAEYEVVEQAHGITKGTT